ncbi:MAG TPA: NUDIX domain-containing protein [Acidimicrobiia bacterium]
MVIQRRAARVLLVADRAVLLIHGRDPARPEAGTWWLTPGGGIDDGESLEAAAVREVREETGLCLDPAAMGPVVATRRAEFTFDGKDFRQAEWFFAVRVDRFAPGADGWDAIEQRALLAHRWWTVEDLERTDEVVYPVELPALVNAVLGGGPAQPMELSGA